MEELKIIPPEGYEAIFKNNEVTFEKIACRKLPSALYEVYNLCNTPSFLGEKYKKELKTFDHLLHMRDIYNKDSDSCYFYYHIILDKYDNWFVDFAAHTKSIFKFIDEDRAKKFLFCFEKDLNQIKPLFGIND